MCNCKFYQFEEINGEIHKIGYPFSDVESLKQKWRDKNSTDKVIQRGRRDIPYEMYCASIDEVFSECKCNAEKG